MNFSYIIKSIILSLSVFIIIISIAFISTQKTFVDNNNYAIKDSLKESINIAEYRINNNIEFDINELIKNTIINYVQNNNINVDEVTFEISLDEEKNIVTTTISTSKDLFNNTSKSSYTFSYQILERWDNFGYRKFTK